MKQHFKIDATKFCFSSRVVSRPIWNSLYKHIICVSAFSCCLMQCELVFGVIICVVFGFFFPIYLCFIDYMLFAVCAVNGSVISLFVSLSSVNK